MAEYPRLDPTPIGTTKGAAGLITYYLLRGESDHIPIIEATLTDETQTTEEVLIASGHKVSSWGRNALEYLAHQGRAERVTMEVKEYMIYGKKCNWRYGWRRPQGQQPVVTGDNADYEPELTL